MKRVNVELSSELHRKAKSLSALEGIPLKEYLKEAIEVRVEHNWKKR